MNTIPGIVESVVTDELFAQIRIVYEGHIFSSCVLLTDHELPYSKIGTPVVMLFKEADTIISLHAESDISCRNRFISKITAITQSNVMTRVVADFNGIAIASLITTGSARFLNLGIGTDIVCMVKSTSLTLNVKDTV